MGDTVAPLLRIVGIEDTSYEKMIVKIYDSPHYLPVLIRSFDTIKVDIRDRTGSRVPFEFGTLTLKLHFRRSDNEDD